jgi:hypothetical protein
MKICHCFIGLLRCIDKTAGHLQSTLFYTGHTYDVVCVTWQSEDTALFKQIFPNATIYKIPDIQEKDNTEFDIWKEGLQLHISLRRSEEQGWPYNGTSGKFHYYRQLYLLRKASDILDSLHKKNTYDLMSRLRTDILIHSETPIFDKYQHMLEYPKNHIFFADLYRHALKKDGEGCPDQFYMGAPDSIIMALKALDFTRKYRISYTEMLTKWFPTPQLEENIIQPESILYYFLVGEGFVPTYLPYRIEIVRA